MAARNVKAEQFADDNSAFDGGHAFVQAAPQCSVCEGFYPCASCLVTCSEDGTIPITSSGNITKTKEVIAEFESGVPKQFQNTLNYDPKKMSVKSMCYKCYGQQFHVNHKYFLNGTEDGTTNIAAEFMNLRKRYYGRSESTETTWCGTYSTKLMISLTLRAA